MTKDRESTIIETYDTELDRLAFIAINNPTGENIAVMCAEITKSADRMAQYIINKIDLPL